MSTQSKPYFWNSLTWVLNRNNRPSRHCTSFLGTSVNAYRYTKFVVKGMAKAETLLKAVLTPLDPQEMLIKNFIILSMDGETDEKSISNNPSKVNEMRDNLVKVLDLKGVKKPDQQPLVDLLLSRLNKNSVHPAVPSLTPAGGSSSQANTLGGPNAMSMKNTVTETGVKLNENFKKFAAAMDMKMDIKGSWLKRENSSTSNNK